MTLDDVYIVPFRVPLRPLMLTAQGSPGVVALKWKLPNINNDPNFYITDSASTYYRYRYYTLERRDISANPSLDASWVVVAPEITIPAPDNGGCGYETEYSVSGLINENNQQFRIRLMIINDYNGQRAFSEWTHMSIINNVAVPESSGNIIYSSVYPYKPSAPVLLIADRTATPNNGPLAGLVIKFNYPSYNGNADYYECEVSYTPVDSFGAEWYDIFSVSNGIANIADNAAILVGGKIRTSGAVGGSSPGHSK